MATSGHPNPRVSSRTKVAHSAQRSTDYRHNRDSHSHHSVREQENAKGTVRYLDQRHTDYRHNRDSDSHSHHSVREQENAKGTARYLDQRHTDNRDRDSSENPSGLSAADASEARVSERIMPPDEEEGGHSSDRESGELSRSRETSMDMQRSNSSSSSSSILSSSSESSHDNGTSSVEKHGSSSAVLPPPPGVANKRKFTPIVWDLDEKRHSQGYGRSSPAANSLPVFAQSESEPSSNDGGGDGDLQVCNRSALSPNESSRQQLSVCDVNDGVLGVNSTHCTTNRSSIRTSRWADKESSPIRTSRWADKERLPARTARLVDDETSSPSGNRKSKGLELPESVPVKTSRPSRWADEEHAPHTEDGYTSVNGKSRVHQSPESNADERISPEEKDTDDSQHRMSPEPGEFIEEKTDSRGTDKENGDGDDVQIDDHHELDSNHSEPMVTNKERDSDEGFSDLESEDEAPMTPPNRSIDMLRACRSVNDFEKLNRVNEGTYGVVYKARDKKTGEIVALKKVKMEKEIEGFPITSLREINILLSIHHPSIVNVKEVVVGGNLDSIFMVMEYMENDLRRHMETMKHPFNERDVKRLMRQLFEGMKYLHDNWIVHRDLKTSNLLLNNSGELKICDFGLARQYGTPLKTYTNNVVTLWYRAPELLLGCKHYSTAVDMWSLGCIMAELLAKEPLFNGQKELDQLNKIFKVLGTPNETVWPDYPNLLKNVKCSFVKQRYNQLREKFPPIAFGRPTLSETGFNLLSRLLLYDPLQRITAEEALNHDWFNNSDGS